MNNGAVAQPTPARDSTSAPEEAGISTDWLLKIVLEENSDDMMHDRPTDVP